MFSTIGRTLFGRVSESEKDALLFNAVPLVYPSLLEGFGLVSRSLEAAQFNCPVLTSESSVCQEVLWLYQLEGVLILILTRLKVLAID